jgi:hypothetical protein
MYRVALAALLLSAAIAGAGEPNLVAEITREFANAAAGQASYNKPECLFDIDGKQVTTGTGISSTNLTVEFVPNSERAQVVLCLSGTLDSRMQTQQGRVTICTNGHVHFRGWKCVCVDGNDVCWGPARVEACPSLQFRGVATQFCLLDPPVRRLATRVYFRKEDESHDKFRWKTERRISEQFDNQADVQLAKASKSYREELLGGLDKNRLRPQELRFSTTTDLLSVRARLEGAAPSDWAPLPALNGRPDIGVRLHQSVLNSGAAAIFAGKTKTGGELEKDMNSLLGPTGKKVAIDPEDREAFSVTFSKGLPIETNFTNQKIKLQIRTDGFVSGERVVSDPFLIESLYDFRRVGAGLELERKDEVDVAPPDVAAGQREISAREQTLSVLLRKRFNKLLPQKINIEKIELPGDLKKVGNMEPTQADSDNGWLTLGLNRATKK